MGLRYKNENRLKDCYESCLQKVSVYNVKSIAFYDIQTGIPGFDPRKAAEMALITARLWLESNYSSIECVIFCTYEYSYYEIYKDVMYTLYFPVSKCHLTSNHMKESPNNNCVANIKNIENHNKLVQNISGLQIYPNTAQNSKSEFPREG